MKIYREERFRTPLEDERSLGLWVDRIGFQRGDNTFPTNFRILGQFAAIAVQNGDGKVHVDGLPIRTVNSGDVILMFPSDPIRYGSKKPWDTCWIVWNGPEAEILHRIGYLNTRDSIVAGGAPAVLKAMARLSPLMERQDHEAVLERKITILEMVRELSSTGRSDDQSGRRSGIDAAVQLLMRQPNARVSMADLAREAGVSHAYFRRLFKAATGTTPKAFQVAQRINRAKAMLAAGQSIKVISEALGFVDAFHFMRVFKRITHQTPGHYAKRRMN